MQEPGDRLKTLADSIRSRNGVNWQTAKFDLQHESVRVEFFRGRDFERYLHANAGLLDEYAGKSGKSVEERIPELGLRFLKSGLITKAQRKFQKPKPGLKRLVKWPKSLLPVPETQGSTWERDLFYVWAYNRPTSSWTYILSSLLVFGIIAGCLLPIAPYIVKLFVFYASASLLFFLLGIVIVRCGVWFGVWVLSGGDFWILPNIMSDELPIQEAITPLVSFKRGVGLKAHILLRMMAAAALGALCFFLLNHNPGGKVVKERAKEAHDTILDFLSIKDPSKQIAGSTNSTEL